MEKDKMDIVIDTSALIAVIVDEPERDKIIEITTGKRNRLDIEEAKRGLEIFSSIPIRYIEPDFTNAVTLSRQTNMYAYDAYFLDCALRQKSPILTLDSRLQETAKNLRISTLEV
jgi:predicted nucleic acid-binding protein